MRKLIVGFGLPALFVLLAKYYPELATKIIMVPIGFLTNLIAHLAHT
jgi:hypothetical protein